MKKKALSAIAAQGVQAGISFVLQILVLRTLGVDDYGRFAAYCAP
jgi:O-antigen/teichoic acid export membrane protein